MARLLGSRCTVCGDFGRVIRTEQRTEFRNRVLMCKRCLAEIAGLCIECGGSATPRVPCKQC